MESAFCRIAPSVLFILLPIRPAGVFLRASDLSSRTCAEVHGRRFVPFFIGSSLLLQNEIVGGNASKEKSGLVALVLYIT